MNDNWSKAGLPDEWRPAKRRNTPCHLPVIGLTKNSPTYPNGDTMTPLIEWLNRDNEEAHKQGIGLLGATIEQLWRDAL